MFRIPEDIDEITGKMQNVKRIEIPECGHLIPLEKPELFSKYINDFAEQLN